MSKFNFVVLVFLFAISSIVRAQDFFAINDIMDSENYFDNHIVSMNYYSAEMAKLNYDTGESLKLGLVKRWQDENLDLVDCKTPRYDIILVTEKGKYGYLTRKELDKLRDEGAIGTTILPFTNRLEFIKDKKSGKVVPTTINKRTAPNFCELHNKALAQYEAYWRAISNAFK